MARRILEVPLEFRLWYSGRLKASGGPKEKHDLRRHFHKQLKQLWHEIPLSAYLQFADRDVQPGDLSARIPAHGKTWVALVCSRLQLHAEIDILFLRPEPPGQAVTQGGDLDNRLKTLLDALKVPRELTALKGIRDLAGDEDPMFCLLEDDGLITHLAVTTDRLLDVDATAGQVQLVLHVRVKHTQMMMGTIGMGS